MKANENPIEIYIDPTQSQHKDYANLWKNYGNFWEIYGNTIQYLIENRYKSVCESYDNPITKLAESFV